MQGSAGMFWMPFTFQLTPQNILNVFKINIIQIDANVWRVFVFNNGKSKTTNNDTGITVIYNKRLKKKLLKICNLKLYFINDVAI